MIRLSDLPPSFLAKPLSNLKMTKIEVSLEADRLDPENVNESVHSRQALLPPQSLNDFFEHTFAVLEEFLKGQIKDKISPLAIKRCLPQ